MAHGICQIHILPGICSVDQLLLRVLATARWSSKRFEEETHPAVLPHTKATFEHFNDLQISYDVLEHHSRSRTRMIMWLQG